MQNKRGQQRRRHSRGYKRRVRQLQIRVGLTLVVLIGVIFALTGLKGKEEPTNKKDVTPIVTDVEEKDIPVEPEEPAKVIVLDPGHGGNDSGSVGTGDVYEKEINLTIVKETANILKEEGFKVVCTRYTDTWVDLDERSKIAERNQADVFVSVHLNSYEEDTSVNGIETHSNGLANVNSTRLAELIQREVIKETMARDRELDKESDLVVVQSKSVPSCLIEAGFITSDKEYSLLLDKAYQKKLAAGIANGIKEFILNN